MTKKKTIANGHAQEEFRIETGIPIPNSYNVRSPLLITLANMEVGQSFVIPKDKANYIRHSASVFAKQSGRKFITRTIEDGQVRLWRAS